MKHKVVGYMIVDLLGEPVLDRPNGRLLVYNNRAQASAESHVVREDVVKVYIQIPEIDEEGP